MEIMEKMRQKAKEGPTRLSKLLRLARLIAPTLWERRFRECRRIEVAALDQENAVPGIEMPASERLLVLSLTTQPMMHFARWLLGQAALRLEAFWLIAGLQLPGVEPIHVATVAPSGVWLYEVVDWSGHLICNAGLWARRERRDGQVVHLPVEGTPQPGAQAEGPGGSAGDRYAADAAPGALAG